MNEHITIQTLCRLLFHYDHMVVHKEELSYKYISKRIIINNKQTWLYPTTADIGYSVTVEDIDFWIKLSLYPIYHDVYSKSKSGTHPNKQKYPYIQLWPTI